MEMEFVVLTKSWKNRGFCIAGVNLENGELVRLISSDRDSFGAIKKSSNLGSNAQVLDVLKVQVVGKECTYAYQPENYLVNENQIFNKIGTMSVNEVMKVLKQDETALLLGSTSHCSDEEAIKYINRSLYVAKVTDFRAYEGERSRESGNPKIKARFVYLGHQYKDMSVTDPEYEQYLNKTISKATLVVSIGAPYGDDRSYFKFISKVFEEQNEDITAD